jgi:hypothetical protein
MANIISKADYLKISDYYADLRAQLTGATHYLYDAAYTVVLLNDFEPTLDLQQPLYDAYISQTSAIQSNAEQSRSSSRRLCFTRRLFLCSEYSG